MMEATSTVTMSRPVFSKQDINQYAGKWVLQRNGKVVLASTDVNEVRAARRDKYDSVGRIPEHRQVL
jgi:hypothetical protein